MGFPGGSDGQESACNVGDLGSMTGLGRSPGEGHSNPLQYSCLENPVDRGGWWSTIHGVTELDITYQLNSNSYQSGHQALIYREGNIQGV